MRPVAEPYRNKNDGAYAQARGTIEFQHGGDNTWNGPIRTRPRGAAVAPGAQGLDRQEAGMTQTLARRKKRFSQERR